MVAGCHPTQMIFKTLMVFFLPKKAFEFYGGRLSSKKLSSDISQLSTGRKAGYYWLATNDYSVICRFELALVFDQI